MNTSLKYVLLVCAAPYSRQGADTALNFAKALIKKQHEIVQVFFYYDGVQVGSALASPEQSERKISRDWAQFGELNKLALVVCSHAAMKRGVLDCQLAEQTSAEGHNLDSRFEMAGLGQFVEAVNNSDRLVSFR